MDVTGTIGSWIEQWMNQYGGGDNWDWDGTNPTFSGYTQDYGVTLAASLSPYQVGPTTSTQESVYTARFGPAPAATTETFDHAYPAADSFTWTLPEPPLSIFWPPVLVEAPAVFPAYAGTKFTVNITPATQAMATGNPTSPAGPAQPVTSQETPTTTWTQSLSIPLATYEEATVTMVVTRGAVTAGATLSITATGKVAAGLNNPWNGHYFWFIPLTDLAQQFNTDPQVTIANGAVVFPVPVSFQGQAVVSSFLQVDTFGPSGAAQRVQNQITQP